MKTKQNILNSWSRLNGDQIASTLNEYFKKKTTNDGTPKDNQRVIHPFEKEMNELHETEKAFDEIFGELAKN